ncbi:efflux RND transporter permease subunit [Sandaracinus amylolyticus]|uniref:efflux RND transporter permease subunit n=1 Tax=Sandaracinus amylolyticus TaxID=927083 RepID=UPI001F023E9F|nr:CusA/CzcA family heavy metal efflux RND transporter [Sandaracinus amylolyticus]UJR78752.1 Cobalt-zinc-cadmium resistance protein CzcA [Sandaracinus amylolyticus]
MIHALVRLCVERRIAALVVTALIAAYGVHAYLRTPIEAFPDVTNLQINVIAQLPGLAPEEIERQLTVPLERVLNGVPGAISMRSESLFGLSLIFITFDDDADVFRSRMLVSERISSADVPEDAEVKLAPDATPLGEVLQYRLSSDRHDLYELRAAQEWTVARVLRQTPGVADVVSFGGYLEELHVEVDPARLEAHDLTLAEIGEALERSSVNVGGGFLPSGEQELGIRGVGVLRGPDDIASVVIRRDEGLPITVGDVARVVQSHTPRRGTVGLDLEPEVVEGFVLLRRGENPSEVLRGVHERIDELHERILPEGMRIEPFYDRTQLVDQTLETVHHSLIEGFLLILGVVWLFLRMLRGSLVVTVIIPLSLLAAFTGLYLLGMPANLISMGAIDFGILVDGAVVLVENVIHEMGVAKPRSRREILGLVVHAAVDVARPTLYAMGIIVAALVPIFSLERVEGRIFRPLALTYSLALAAALVLALTIVPALLAVVLRPKDASLQEPRFVGLLRERYRRIVAAGITRPAIPLVIGALVLGAAGLVGARLGTEFLPALDEGDIVVFVEMPASISLEEGRDVLHEVRTRIVALPEVVATMSEHGRPEDGTDNEGSNMSETFVRLRPRDEWRPGVTKDSLIDEMRESLTAIPGVRFNFSQPIKDNVEESGSGVRGQVVLKVFGDDLDAMRGALASAVETLSGIEGIVDLDIYRDTSMPQLQVELDREALAREGIAMEDAQRTLETALAGAVVNEMWIGARPVPVRLRLPVGEREDRDRIGEILVPNASGARVPLRDLARIDVRTGRASINREDNSRTMALKFNVQGRDLGSVIAEAMAAVDANVHPPDGHWLVWSGEFENQQRAMERLSVIVPLSLLVVLGLLYSALGSMRSAAMILLAAPFALTGGVFALAAFGIPLSVSAAVGFIALLGQVSLAGLLVLSAVEQRWRAGAPRVQALTEGAALRFRAVLLTALLAMLGLVPMALGTGVGSETQRPFALVIVGGMATTLLVALFVLPALYALLGPRALATKEAIDEEATRPLTEEAH